MELATGFLGRSATALTEVLSGVGGAEFDSPVKNAIKAGGHPLEVVASWIGPSLWTAGMDR